VTAARQYPPALVSVVIPSLNSAATLGAQLDALAVQTYTGDWEVAVLDNGSVDGSDELAMRWANRLPGLRVVRVADRGISHVRNAARSAARGELLAFCDADDIVVPGWLDALVTAASMHDLVGGRLDDLSLNSAEVVAWRGELPADRLLVPMGYLPMAPGGNCAVWRDVIEALQGWDTGYVAGSDDVDFAWRAQERGYSVGFAPEAVIAYRYRADARSLYKQVFRYGRTEARLARRFPAVRRSTAGELLRLWLALLARLGALRRRDVHRVILLREIAYRAGRLYGSARERTLIA
jgi:glycosyltransferase involved in cell wall biosynthesis